MLPYISNIEKLFNECDEIQALLEIPVSDDMNELIEHGNKLIIELARTGKMLSDAKYLQDQAINKSIIQILKDNKNISPSIAKQLIDSSTEKENYLVSWCDRLNRSCTHQLDWIRSVVSKNKEEMKLNQFMK